MKKVSITVRDEEYEALKRLLEPYHYLESRGESVHEIRLYLPNAELDDFITAVKDTLDLRYKANTIEVVTPDFVVSPFLARVERRAEGEKAEKSPVEQLLQAAEPNTRLEPSRVVITCIAGIIALSGLFLNNATLIIGAMLLSPILAPISAFAIFVAHGDMRDALRSIGLLLVLLGSVIAVSFLTTLVVYPMLAPPITPEITLRTVTNPIYILMAVFLGFATILAIQRGLLEVIAGVSVAVALIPPTVVTGIYLFVDPFLALRSLLLVLENLVGLLTGTLAATAFLRIAPRTQDQKGIARRALLRVSAVLVILMIIIIALAIFV
ncbi:MAG: TIGR00341 family protein [Methanomicrobiales archaeon]|nr:TIGR00341 family protein [Methanomicrobiales archaeon]MDI6876345.1 TIGR00341 family protein [Methanomicrobiales archaeon]